MSYCHVLISAENAEQATAILDALLPEELIFGGPVLEGPAKFWWKREIVSMRYAFILTYAREDRKAEVARRAEEASAEEVCMVSFMPMEPNEPLK
ncbi:hypothetical protein GVX82_03695 [Patescibacteria group bacterium]|jgi:uncharacterized protein involved in tolerance to divalent cations|nr:hypothetical protein [Patescibacteria group bacterium]